MSEIEEIKLKREPSSPKFIRDKWKLFLIINGSFVPRKTEGFEVFKKKSFGEIDEEFGTFRQGYIPNPEYSK
jgi:hypothetical protein